MIQKRLGLSGRRRTSAFVVAAWLLFASNLHVSWADMSNEVDSDLSSSMSLGVGGNDLALTQDGIGNNSVTAVRPGEAARLSCPIPAEMFGTKVSWIRRGDLQLLSVGENLYVNDQRLFVSHSRHSRNAHHSQVWFLHLMNVTKRDEGEYECQMSTHPHVSIFTYLKVQNAYSRVEGPEERVVASGSDLRLVCIIEGASSKPSYVFWYHYERMVNYDAARGITVTQSSPMRSTLAISEVTADHAGNYTCQPSNAVPASVDVHVVAGNLHLVSRERSMAPVTSYQCDEKVGRVEGPWRTIIYLGRDFMSRGSLVLAITREGFRTELYRALFLPFYRREDERTLPCLR